MSALRVLVCGGRTYADRGRLFAELDALRKSFGILCIIEGGAQGADRLAREWALANGQDTWTIEADWKKHGRAAGPIRNQRMLDEAKPDRVLAFPGGKGTADMLRRARQTDVMITEILP